ncbi:uncharacterized protein TNCV_1010171 [Trichonephila clavipes]|nr:uncharacterized protein TNCV_1010171 [Trichonephila clavipes]
MTPELAPPLLTTTPHQREDVSALDRFNVHRCPTRRVFSGTGIELVTRQATHLVETLKERETSKNHSQSQKSWIEFNQRLQYCKTIDRDSQKLIIAETNYWSEVILSMDELNLDQAPQDINKEEFQVERIRLEAFEAATEAGCKKELMRSGSLWVY